MVYDIAIVYGYDFYITGLDSLIGEILHVPEAYPVLLVVEEAGIKEIHDALSEKGLIVFTEKDKGIIENAAIKSKIELSRIHQSLQRNRSLAKAELKHAARDRGIITEINWLMEINKASDKVLEFMSYQMKKDD